ncbi:MAG: hypothetical protein Q7R49_06775 [Candidatus Daviesbacteria bacterium]|nr:hypothetical protein [Candidatus Daviesbacteria bacterium]
MASAERPSFRENFFAPISYVRELRSKGIQKKDLPLLITVGLFEGALLSLAVQNFNDDDILVAAARFVVINLLVHTMTSLMGSRNMPEDFIPF